MRKPKLCFVTMHCCTRVLKEALALLKKGYEIHLVTALHPPESKWFHSVHMHNTKIQLTNAIRQVDADIYHVHNEPTWLVQRTREAIGKKPLVFDAHDWEILRCDSHKTEDLPIWKLKILWDEAEAVGMSDAIVFISEPIQKYMLKRYPEFKKPNIFLESWVNEDFANTPEHLPKEGTVVYQGGTAGSIKVRKSLPQPQGGEEWRNYLKVAKGFVDSDIDFHIYGFFQSDREKKEYEDTGATIHVPVPRPHLMKEMAKYQWGIFGTGDKSKNMKWCLPNKVFEYTMAGIPTILYGKVDESKKFVEEHGVGIVLDSLENIQLPDAREFKENIWKTRPNITMEQHIHKLEGLYKELLS